MRSTSFILLGGAIAAPAAAGTINVTIPRLSVAEYHPPYVAVWLEPTAGGAPRTIAVWYNVKKLGAEPGTKWLAEMRTWWRKAGRSMTVPADGITGATRAPGQYNITLPADVKPGAYVLNVEAARESGGRELVSTPLTVPGTARAAGKAELGAITVSAR
ncbi:DUF2271 domain-containing protein [Sphingomonas nostoxanthinifaciens]|uniref:DUF2271 domain-containing protein n=1 Tax=Sphingomonas nostoxanthinifaciens TaxID=2872652 RepID=UPI001CC1CC8D|nr:DUF2271 domain-containing protein [Sphingomonas nostoxanthinifaciens]UAK26069.1 DUF2271 domain-containing protein [Sphingomonas nostoxanthinifaciens]